MILYFSLVNYFKVKRVRLVDHGLILDSADQIEVALRKEKGAIREMQPQMLAKDATLST